MLTSFLVIAESGQTWTPETFYLAAMVVQLIALLLFFRFAQMPKEYSTFINGLFIVLPVNGLAYFTKDMGLVGVLITGSVLFILLAAVTRGDVFRATGGWFLALVVYWGLAYFIIPAEDDLYIEDLGNLPQVLMQGGLEAETLTAEEFDREDPDEPRRAPDR